MAGGNTKHGASRKECASWRSKGETWGITGERRQLRPPNYLPSEYVMRLVLAGFGLLPPQRVPFGFEKQSRLKRRKLRVFRPALLLIRNWQSDFWPTEALIREGMKVGKWPFRLTKSCSQILKHVKSSPWSHARQRKDDTFRLNTIWKWKLRSFPTFEYQFETSVILPDVYWTSGKIQRQSHTPGKIFLVSLKNRRFFGEIKSGFQIIVKKSKSNCRAWIFNKTISYNKINNLHMY